MSEERRSATGDHTKPERETGQLTVRLLLRNGTGVAAVTRRKGVRVAVVPADGGGRVVAVAVATGRQGPD